MPEETDETIAKKVQSGDYESFGILVGRYEAKLKRYARRYLSDVDDIDDVVQDVFLKAYENINSFDSTRRFSPWIYRIAHNAYANALRGKRPPFLSIFEDVDILFPHPVAEETADSDTEIDDVRASLEKSMSKIPSKYREVLTLHYFEELDYREIADILHIPVSTVGVRLKRGREVLKREVSSQPGSDTL